MTLKTIKSFEDFRFLRDDYGNDFARAVSDIGTTVNTSLVVEHAGFCTLTVSAAANIDVVWFPNAICNVSGSLTIAGALFAGYYQIFSGAGTIVLGSNILEVLPIWFGEDSTSLTKTRAAIASSGIPMNLGKISADPTTSGWGVAESGSHWYNSTDNKKKMWNGSAIVLIG